MFRSTGVAPMATSLDFIVGPSPPSYQGASHVVERTSGTRGPLFRQRLFDMQRFDIRRMSVLEWAP